MASTAIPFVFPAVRVGDDYYMDGSVRQIAPLVAGAAPRRDADRRHRRRSVHRAARRRRPRAARYPSLGQIAGHALSSVFLDNLGADLERLYTINRLCDALPRARSAQRRRRARTSTCSSSFRRATSARSRCSYADRLPRGVRYLLRGLGSTQGTGANLLVLPAVRPRILPRADALGLRRRDGAARRDRGFPRRRVGQLRAAVSAGMALTCTRHHRRPAITPRDRDHAPHRSQNRAATSFAACRRTDFTASSTTSGATPAIRASSSACTASAATAATSTSWAKRWPRTHRVLAVDMPGRGESDWLADPNDYVFPTYLTTLDRADRAKRRGDRSTGSARRWAACSASSWRRSRRARSRGSSSTTSGPSSSRPRSSGFAATSASIPTFATYAEIEHYIRTVSAPFGPLTDAQWEHVTRTNVRQRPDGRWGLAYDPGHRGAVPRERRAARSLGRLGRDPLPDARAARRAVRSPVVRDGRTDGGARAEARRSSSSPASATRRCCCRPSRSSRSRASSRAPGRSRTMAAPRRDARRMRHPAAQRRNGRHRLQSRVAHGPDAQPSAPRPPAGQSAGNPARRRSARGSTRR